MSDDGLVAGTYVHGIFDHPESLTALLAWAGLRDAQTLDLSAMREASIDRIADMVDAYMDTAALGALLGMEAPHAA